MSKLDVDHHVNIEIDEEDLKEIQVKKDATYPEIKDYVSKKYGFKVSSLYIAQVKRQFGLVERENYNKSNKLKSEQRVPNCPPEKVEAIKDALAWFGMI
ncbi:50S ribosomal protein L23 [Streptococcus orisratti]|uniref:50S ribosomal protein L23 n=1 Tax=Streptococcus orisratti TaxID=114652 RepID=UPI00035F768D|nr:50S ribosomal protein L23 [Streptococcus orisratti]